jgi:hypothetical protein
MSLDLTEIDKDTAFDLSRLFTEIGNYKHYERDLKDMEGNTFELTTYRNGLKFFYKTNNPKMYQCLQELFAETIQKDETEIKNLLTRFEK